MKIKKIVLLLLITFCLTGFLSGQDSRYDADKNLPFNQKAGDVNPQTGTVTLSYTDLALPGRAGYNFQFSRIWNLNQSNVFNMYFKDGTNRLNSNTVEKYSRLGTGWSSSLPYIVKNQDSQATTLNLFFGGNVFQIDQSGLPVNNPARSNLTGYDLTDLRIFEHSGAGYGEFTGLSALLAKYTGLTDSSTAYSKYQLVLKSNESYFFREDGQVMMQQDKTGLNRIWYFYENDPENTEVGRLKVVVDTIGREIVFDYDSAGNLAGISWKVTKGVLLANGVRQQAEESRTVSYSYLDGETFPEINSLKESVLDYQKPYVLSTVTNPMGQVILFDYKAGTAGFTFNSAQQHSQNVYLMMTSITEQYTAVDGKFKNKRCFEYEVPAEGMFTKYFYNGYMQNYRISRQYVMNKFSTGMNDTRYFYFEKGTNGNFNQYSTEVVTGGVKNTYIYSLSSSKNRDHVLDSLKTESSDGFIELKEFEYNSDRTKYLETVFRKGSWVGEEKFLYDTKGNLKRHTARNGLVTITEYDDTFSQPIKITQKVTVKGVLTGYVKENVINSLGQVEKEIFYTAAHGAVEIANYTYDEYGNPETKTDAAGNRETTIFDEENHIFPVKTYRDVQIDSWSGGDVSTKWTSAPDGKKLVRIRNWKVFNTDGTVWIEVDNEGYAIEHYYDKLGEEIEIINPDLNDEKGFANPIVLTGWDGTGDFNNFLLNPAFGAFLTSRQDNPGARMTIDYQNDFVLTETDLDRSNGFVTGISQEGDGLGHIIKEIKYKGILEHSVKIMDYDLLGRMVALTDSDANPGNSSPTSVNGVTVNRYDKTWIIKYDDLGRQTKVWYPDSNASSGTDIKYISYDDVNNIVTTRDTENRLKDEQFDWSGNPVKIVRYGDETTSSDKFETYEFAYDELNRKIKFTDAKGLVTSYNYNEMSLLTEQNYGNGSDLMSYNKLGKLVKKTDRKGQVITFTYDEMGRNTRTTHYTSQQNLNNNVLYSETVMAYDNRGNAVWIAGPNLIEYYEYDYGNRITTLKRRLKDSAVRSTVAEVWGGEAAAQTFAFSYTYNDAGIVTKMVYPDGAVHTFDYDSQLAQLTGINEGVNEASLAGFVTALEYNKSGVVTRMDYANQTSQSWDFDNRKRISGINITGNAGKIVDLKYTLNSTGDVLSINGNEYRYDGFDRIIGAKTQYPGAVDKHKLIAAHFGSYADGDQGSGLSYNAAADFNDDGRINGEDHLIASYDSPEDIYDIESFEYDKNGNRTRLEQNGDIYTYTYGERNKLEQVHLLKKGETVKILFAAYVYDANGNTVKRTIYGEEGDTVVEFSYDTMNRLVKTIKNTTKITEYFYDNAGNRFIKKNEDGTTLYLRHGQLAVAMDVEIFAESTGEETPAEPELPYGTDSLTSLWKFEEESGTVTTDSQGGAAGTLNGAVFTSDPERGTVVTLSQDSDSIDCGNEAAFEMGTSDMTVAAWVKIPSLSNENHDFLTILGNGATSTTVNGYMMSYVNDKTSGTSDDGLIFWISNGETRVYPYTTGDLGLDDGQWHHVAVTVDRSSTVEFYVDGVQVASNSNDISGLENTVVSNYSAGAKIGNWRGNDGLIGSIDTLFVYKKVLSPSELTQVRNYNPEDEIPAPVPEVPIRAKINRYVLSGDLLAGRITTTIRRDNTSETAKYFYHLDHLNSTKAVTKQDGTIEVIYEYRAFGEQLKRLDAAGNDTGDNAKYSYGGKELDEVTDLYYFNARYYDAVTGRFINVDPIQDGTNWYVYCNNNPLNMVDPTGLKEYMARVVTGVTADNEEVQFIAKHSDEKSMEMMDNIYKNMTDLGWDVTMNDIVVKEGFLWGKDEITAISDVDDQGMSLNWEQVSKDAARDYVADIAATRIWVINKAYNTIGLGKTFAYTIKKSKQMQDGTYQLNYYLTRSTDMYNDVTVWDNPHIESEPGTLAYAKELAAWAFMGNGDFERNFYYKETCKLLLASMSFVYW